MSRAFSWSLARCIGFVLLVAMCRPLVAQDGTDPTKLLTEAERLAWLKAWTPAASLYAEAEKLFSARGDRRNALYAQVNHLRGRLPQLPVPEVSQRLAEYLDDPLVQGDDRLRLRCLVIKGETDTDLDPVLAERSWREAREIAERLGEAAWANRAQGELGLLAFLQGNVNAAIIQLGQALKVAETNGDTPSVVRWLTLFGHGYMQLGRAEEALDFYDRALNIAAGVPELQFPVMTYLGKGDALTKLGRLDEAEQLLTRALEAAADQESWGYQAELTMMLAAIAQARKQPGEAARLLARAADFAHRAGGNRIVAQVALERGRLLRRQQRREESSRVLEEGIRVARAMQERLLLPRLLAELAELRASEGRYADAGDLLQEASDLFEGFLGTASSPWVQGRIVNGLQEVFLARIRLEGARGPDAARLFGIVEQARGRALLELLMATPPGDVPIPAALRSGERRLAALQSQLFRARTREERGRLLDRIFVAEEQLAPLTTAFFERTRRSTSGRRPIGVTDLQRALRADELFLEFAIAEPRSYVLIVTRTTARVEALESRRTIDRQAKAVVDRIRGNQAAGADVQTLSATLLDPVRELTMYPRVIISPDGELHYLPFELLAHKAGRRLLETHVVSYVPSGSVLVLLRQRHPVQPLRAALAVSASADQPGLPQNGSGVERGVYDLDFAKLRPLPAADDEARMVGALMGTSATVLLGAAATEAAIKRQVLEEYRVLHFAVHGVPSTRFPARSALLLQAAEGEDGLLQAREILTLRLRAALVTLSACDTGAGSLQEQEGVASLVRPFLAAGARSVVASLWAADDQFSLSLMREFYAGLTAGNDVGEALRRAKLRMLDLFGPDVAPRLWSGVIVYGDGTATVASASRQTGL